MNSCGRSLRPWERSYYGSADWTGPDIEGYSLTGPCPMDEFLRGGDDRLRPHGAVLLGGARGVCDARRGWSLQFVVSTICAADSRTARVVPRPRRDVLRILNDLAVVKDQYRDPTLASQPLDLLTPTGDGRAAAPGRRTSPPPASVRLASARRGRSCTGGHWGATSVRSAATGLERFPSRRRASWLHDMRASGAAVPMPPPATIAFRARAPDSAGPDDRGSSISEVSGSIVGSPASGGNALLMLRSRTASCLLVTSERPIGQPADSRRQAAVSLLSMPASRAVGRDFPKSAEPEQAFQPVSRPRAGCQARGCHSLKTVVLA
jgi:hypothetical protein